MVKGKDDEDRLPLLDDDVEYDNCLENLNEDNDDGYLSSVDNFHTNWKTINSIKDDGCSNADDAEMPYDNDDSKEHVDDTIALIKVQISTNPTPSPIPSIDLEMTHQNQRNEESQKININGNNVTTYGNDNADLYYDGPKLWKRLEKNWKTVSQPIALFFIFLILWAMIYASYPLHAEPTSAIMRLAFLFIGAHVSGLIVEIIGLPDMIGMLAWGVLFANLGIGKFEGYQNLEAFLRELALVNIMLLAGLGLDWNSLKKLFGMVMRLTLIPTIAETVIITVLAHFLMGMPWLWGILLGLVITAISPNVVITILLGLKVERLGLNKGIHTLIIAVTSCNDVISIFLFGVILGVIFSTGPLTQQILQGPVGVGIGGVYGFLFGILLCYLPSNKSKYANGLRFTMMLLGGQFSVMGSRAIGYPSAGALGCIVIAFVAGIGWKRCHTGKESCDVDVKLDLLWKFVKPISFSLIGKELNISVLDGKIVGFGLVILMVGCAFRLISSYLSTYGGDLNWKERAYVSLSGFPKATVQAALGPLALDSARKINSSDKIQLANNVLITSVIAIIVTAPIGAFLMTKLAPKWLKRSPQENTETIVLS